MFHLPPSLQLLLSNHQPLVDFMNLEDELQAFRGAKILINYYLVNECAAFSD